MASIAKKGFQQYLIQLQRHPLRTKVYAHLFFNDFLWNPWLVCFVFDQKFRKIETFCDFRLFFSSWFSKMLTFSHSIMILVVFVGILANSVFWGLGHHFSSILLIWDFGDTVCVVWTGTYSWVFISHQWCCISEAHGDSETSIKKACSQSGMVLSFTFDCGSLVLPISQNMCVFNFSVCTCFSVSSNST